MSKDKSFNKFENQQISLQLRDIFMVLCSAFTDGVLSVDSDQVRSIQSQIIVRQAKYESSELELSDEVLTELKNTKGHSCPHHKLSNEEKPLRNSQQQSNKFISEEDYFNSLRKHTKDVANLNQYNLENLIQGKYHNYLWSPVKGLVKVDNHAIDTTVVPIGEYGYDCALKMLYTTVILVSLCDHLVCNVAASTETKNWEFLSCETATGRQKKRAQDELGHCASKNHMENLDEYHSLLKKSQTISALDSFKEGVQSLQSAISSLMAQEVKSYSAESLLEAILDAELPTEFSRIVPFGYTLPVTRSGRFFPRILQDSCRENAYPNVRISSEFKRMARLIKEEYLLKKVYVSSQHNPGFSGNGCPLSFHKPGFINTGIGYVANAYRHIFKLVKI